MGNIQNFPIYCKQNKGKESTRMKILSRIDSIQIFSEVLRFLLTLYFTDTKLRSGEPNQKQQLASNNIDDIKLIDFCPDLCDRTINSTLWHASQRMSYF